MRRLLLTSHCLLNPWTRVHGVEPQSDLAGEALRTALEADVALLQLPCPEFTHGGPDRASQTVAQYDHRYYRAHCDRLAAAVADQVAEQVRDGVILLGFLAVDQSPSCSTQPPQGVFARALLRALAHLGLPRQICAALPVPDAPPADRRTFQRSFSAMLRRRPLARSRAPGVY